MKQKLSITHSVVYFGSIVIVLGAIMSLLTFFPVLREKEVELKSPLPVGVMHTEVLEEDVENNEDMGEQYAERKKVERIASMIQGELPLGSDFARKISASIYNHTKDTTISPELVVAVMKIESHGRPRVVSSAGAMGLMQIMPFWKKVMNMENADLFDVDTNIKMGVNVLSRYIHRYKKIEKALAAYNGSLGSSRYPKKVLKVYRKMVGKMLSEV